MSSPNSPIENGDVNEHSSTDEEQEPISYNNPLSALTSFTPLDLNEDTDEMSNDDEEQEETNKPPPLTSEQAKQHKLAWDAYTSRSRKLTAEELHLVAVYGPPEDEEDEAQEEEEDIDGMVILSSSNRTELQPSQTTVEDVDDTTIDIPEPIQDDYNEYEQIFFDDSSDGESTKKKKRRKKKQIEEESDGEFHPPPKTSKLKKSKKNLRHRRTSPEPPPPPPAIVEIVPQPFLDIICVHCKKGDKEDELLLCDKCDIGSWHMSCLNPPLTQLPSENEQWFCPSCSEESTKLKMLELSDIIREKDRVIAQIKANLMKRKSIENEKIEIDQKPPPIEKPPEPKKTYEKKIEIISTPIPSESLSNTTSSTSSNLLLLNKSFSINSQNVTKKPPSNPTNSPFWIGPLYWDDKCICKVAVYFPSVPTPISQDLKHNFPENLKISSSKDFPANTLKNSNVEIVPETDHATFLYFMHSMERSKNVGTMWLGAIGPNIYFVPNKSKKTISIYVPVKPVNDGIKSNNPVVTNNVVSNNNVQYLVQIAPGQFVSVTSDMMVPVQYYPVPQSTAFVTLPPQPTVPQQQRSSPKKIASPVNKS